MTVVPSLANSTITPLGANGTWVGGAEKSKAFAGVAVSVSSDRDGELVIESSTNGFNWTTVFTLSYDAAADGVKIVQIPFSCIFARARFVNTSGVSQGSLIISTTFSTIPPTPPPPPPTQPINVATGSIGNIHNGTLINGQPTAAFPVDDFIFGTLFITGFPGFHRYRVDVSLDGGKNWDHYATVDTSPKKGVTTQHGIIRDIQLVGITHMRVTNDSGKRVTDCTISLVGPRR